METKPYSEVSQQLRNYNISVPKFEDRGDLNEMDDIMPKDGVCSIYRTTNVEKYRDVMEHFLKLMALEASSATHSDGIDELILFTGHTLDGDRPKDKMWVGFAALDRNLDKRSTMVRYMWLHPFLRNQSLMRVALSRIFLENWVVANNPTTPYCDRVFTSCMNRQLKILYQMVEDLETCDKETFCDMANYVLNYVNNLFDIHNENLIKYKSKDSDNPDPSEVAYHLIFLKKEAQKFIDSHKTE